MYKFLSKNGQLITWIVGAVIAISFLVIANTSVPESMGPGIFKDGTVPKPAAEVQTILEGIHYFDIGFYATYVLLVLAVAAAILFSLVYFVTNFSLKSLRNLIPIIIIAIVFFAVYSSYNADLSDAYTVKKARVDFNVSANESQIVSGGVLSGLFALGAAVVSLVVMEVVNFFK